MKLGEVVKNVLSFHNWKAKNSGKSPSSFEFLSFVTFFHPSFMDEKVDFAKDGGGREKKDAAAQANAWQTRLIG